MADGRRHCRGRSGHGADRLDSGLCHACPGGGRRGQTPATPGVFSVALDLIRAVVIACLPFVDPAQEIHVLISFLQTTSAALALAFLAVISGVATVRNDDTNTMSLLCLAVDLGKLASSMIAALLRTMVSLPV